MRHRIKVLRDGEVLELPASAVQKGDHVVSERELEKLTKPEPVVEEEPLVVIPEAELDEA